MVEVGACRAHCDGLPDWLSLSLLHVVLPLCLALPVFSVALHQQALAPGATLTRRVKVLRRPGEGAGDRGRGGTLERGVAGVYCDLTEEVILAYYSDIKEGTTVHE